MATRKTTPAPARKSAVAKKSPAGRKAPTTPRGHWATLKAATSTPKARAAALAALGWAIADDRASYRSVLALVTDTQQPTALRAAALAAVQSVSFDAQRFAALRPDHLRALRKLCDDPDLELRQRALGMLMREGDAPTQQRLLAGLRDTAQALLPPEKALQLLAYDLHGDAYAAAREVATKPPNPLARREALRLLAADADSVPIFEGILQDQNESSELRRLSASALHQLSPRRLQTLAREITMNSDDGDDELRTSCLVALAQFGDADTIRGDAALNEKVDKLDAGAAAESALGQAAQQFIVRYKR